jgi:hypothetical protein
MVCPIIGTSSAVEIGTYGHGGKLYLTKLRQFRPKGKCAKTRLVFVLTPVLRKETGYD